MEDRTLLNAYVVTLAGDANVGTTTSTGGSGDIRFAIEQANLNPNSTITFNTAAIGGNTINLSHGELEISANMTITGPGPSNSSIIINGNGPPPAGQLSGASRVFNIENASAVVSISNMTIANGNAAVTYTSVAGNQGGDIFNSGNLTLTNDVVSDGLSQGVNGIGGPPGRGGGIFNAEGASGTTGATLVLNSVIVENNTAEGIGGGAGGLGAGGGIWNDPNATLTVKGSSQFFNNQALGWNSPNGTPFGGSSINAGPGEGGGIFNEGNLNLNGTSTTPLVFIDNEAIGGKGGNGAIGFTPPTTGSGGPGGNGGAGGVALGGGVYNTSSAFTLQYVNFQGNLANGGKGGDGGRGGDAKGNKGWAGGPGGAGAAGGFAEGGAIFNGVGALTVPNVIFGTDSTGLGNEANGGNGGKGGDGGNGTTGSIKGGHGGNGGDAGSAGLARGGAIANLGGALTVTSATFDSSQANGGAGGNGGRGGNGGPGSGAGIPGGEGGNQVGFPGGTFKGGAGGSAQGGAVYNDNGSLSFTSVSVTGSVANGGVGGNGGNGGNGGPGGVGGNSSNDTAGQGGAGGAGGNAGVAGLAEAGAGGNEGSHENISSSTFTAAYTQSGTGGAGGNGGTGGNGGNGKFNGLGGSGGNAGAGGNSAIAFGGALAITTSDLTVTNSSFGGNQVIGGAGGAGGIGGTVGQFGNPGTYIYQGAPMYLTGKEVAGNGGTGGLGAYVYGGAISTSQSAQAVTITSSTFTNNTINSGAGGAGGPGGWFGFRNTNGGINGDGGNAGWAIGGTFSFAATSAQDAILTNDAVLNSSASGGVGGAGAINFGINPTTGNPIIPTVATGGAGVGSAAGIGGSVQGVDLANVDYNLSITSTTLNNGTGQAGAGGVGGGGGSPQVPYSFQGGSGSNGGSIQGGAVFFSNSLAQTTLDFFFNGSTGSNNTLKAGNGGQGGNAGASGNKSITGGAGGNGGTAQGGGLYILTGGNSVTVTSLNSANLVNDTVAGGAGGIGGAGYNSIGGNGGNAQGGALYNDSVNTTKPSNLSITAVTLASDQATGGNAGRAGSGTTNNGGAGGPGGNGGNADGGALYNGDNTLLTVINSTLGGSGSSANIVSGGLGGRGGNAGTPANEPSNNGGAGGNGGSVAGGNVYVASNSATFEDDTIVFGQAAVYGLGGAGGGGAGKGGQPGPAGANGTGTAGGYFAGSGSTNTIANTIIALDIAQTNADVSGSFTSMNSAGHNVIGDATGSTGFSTANGDQIGVTAPQLNLGPLQNNGGPNLGAPGNTSPTLTDALLSGSVAIAAGNPALLPATLTTDQRGPGFARTLNGNLDVGAFQTQAPPAPPSPPSPPGPPAPPPGTKGLTTITTIVSIQNTYPGLVQMETVTVDVTNVNGFIVNEGVVAFQVDGQTVFAPVHNGVATATVATGLLDLAVWMDLLFPHPLTASYSDSFGVFAPSGTGTTVQAIWIDFFLSLLASQLRGLTQLQPG